MQAELYLAKNGLWRWKCDMKWGVMFTKGQFKTMQDARDDLLLTYGRATTIFEGKPSIKIIKKEK